MLIFTVLCLLLSSLVEFEAVLTSSSRHMCHFHESISLIQFKKAMHNLNSSISSPFCNHYSQCSYPKMISWNKTSSDCCTWDGVKCHEITGHIIGLDLSCSRLKGVIYPNSSLFRLSHLQKLNLAHNDFSFSKVSPNIERLSCLAHLNFSASRFEGIIPLDFFHLSKLVLLDLSGNVNLIFSPGHFHILIQNHSHVRVLCLNGVQILANLPENWSSSSLTYIDLGHTELRGKLPKSIFHLPRLRTLVLGGNKNLSVSLPKGNRSNTSSLQVLDLSHTNVNVDGFTDSIQSFAQLKSLSLSGCELTGSFPNSIGNLSQIVQLDLSLNKFTGDFSSVISDLPTKVGDLNLNWNSFTGKFPSHTRNLTRLCLRHNFLNGTLPFTMSVLPKLGTLYLSCNAFDGQIPSWLFSSPSITHLDLSENNLIGQIIEFTAKSLVRIDLSSNNLNGSIDFTVFKHLKKLETLKLSDNKLSFKIEDKIKLSLPNLSYLALSSCQITEFPSFLINSKNLVFLDLSNNKLIGQISYMIPWYSLSNLNLSRNLLSHLGSLNTITLIKTLEVLDLSSNKFEGLLPLSICHLKNLYVLDLSHNNFIGAIPQCYGGFSSVLEMLNLEKNDLEEIISMNFPKVNGLMYLNLNGNSLQGTLPESLDNCKYLIVLDVGYNRIKDAFPNLENLANLQVLILKSNRFFGSISNVKNDFFSPKLQVFDLSCNEFNGSLPVELLKSFKAMMTSVKIEVEASEWNHENDFYRYPISIPMKGGVFQFSGMLTTIVAIDLSSNHFEGEIPEVIGNLNSLVVLNLSHNNFCGSIPSTLAQLNFLESLDLSFNLFGGIIPWGLADLTFLEILNLSQNCLVGPIPQGKQFNTFLNDSYSGNLGLCGFPLTMKCAERYPQLHPSHGSSYQYDTDSRLWCEFTRMALLIGYIFGMVFGYILFFIGKPRWLVRNIEEVFWCGLLLIVRMKKNRKATKRS